MPAGNCAAVVLQKATKDSGCCTAYSQEGPKQPILLWLPQDVEHDKLALALTATCLPHGDPHRASSGWVLLVGMT
jgi:hypothetical protein